jgi:hypothetical protein
MRFSNLRTMPSGRSARQLVVVDADRAAGDAGQFQGQVWFEDAAWGGDDVEAAKGSDVVGPAPGGELDGVGTVSLIVASCVPDSGVTRLS